jgi:NADPH2:quinone reductase
MKAVRIHQTGGPEVLKYEDVPTPQPGQGEAVVQIEAIGVNFIDVYFRSGVYKTAFPYTPGMEGAGVVSTVGAGVTDLKQGDRVAYAMHPGAYAEYAVVPAWKLVKLPADVDFTQGAAIMLQGMTAHYLAYSTFPLKPQHTAVVHAGAGGVGLLLTQIARRIGTTVITTVGSEQKAELSRQAGANHVILYTKQEFDKEVRQITNGAGVDVVYDSVGVTTFERGLNCLKTRGYMVLFGQSSGVVPPFDPGILAAKGSLFLTRPSLANYASTPEDLRWRAGDLFQWVGSGDLKLRIEHVFPLVDVAKAHEALEGRRTTGKVVLKP